MLRKKILAFMVAVSFLALPLAAQQASEQEVAEKPGVLSGVHEVDTTLSALEVLPSLTEFGVLDIHLSGTVTATELDVDVVGLDRHGEALVWGELTNRGLEFFDAVGEKIDLPIVFPEVESPIYTKASAPCQIERTFVVSLCGSLAAEIITDLVNGQFTPLAWIRALATAALKGIPCSGAVIAWNECLRRSGTPFTGFASGSSYYYGCRSTSQWFFAGSLGNSFDDQCF